MVDTVKISALPAANTLSGSEVLAAVQSNNTVGASVNQILNFVQNNISTGSSNIGALTDTNIGTPQTDQALRWNGSNWVNGAATVAHTHTLSEIIDSGTAASLDSGSAIGDAVELENVGGNAGLPAVDGSQLTNVGGGANALDELNDVTSMLSPSDNDVLTFNSTNGVWESQAATSGASALPGLSDVSNTLAQTDGNSLTWSSSSSAWISVAKADAGHTHNLADITDSGSAAAENVGTTIGDVVQLDDVGGSAGLPAVDGSQLTNVGGGASSLSGLSDVSGTLSPSADDVLQFNGSVWVANALNIAGSGVSFDDSTNVFTGSDIQTALESAGSLAVLNTVTTSDVATASRSGADSTLITGTAGTSGNFSQWNADGDLVDSGNSASSFAASGHTHTLGDITNSGTAAAQDTGTAIGNVVQLEDVGGSAGLPAVDGSQLSGVAAEDTTSFLGATSANITLDLSADDYFNIEAGGDFDISFSGLSNGILRRTLVEIINGGDHNITWSNIAWDGGVNPSLSPSIGLYDLASATFDKVASVSANLSFPSGMYIGNNGNKLFLSENVSTIHEYDFNTAWEIDSIVHVQTFDVSAQETRIRGVAFKDDGTIMYVIGTSDVINQYTLSTAWDISTASFNNVTLDVSGQITDGWGITIGDNGTKLIISDDSNNIAQYTLGTAWDISTGSHDKTFNPSLTSTLLSDITVNDSGDKMYVSTKDGFVTQFSLGSFWDIGAATQEFQFDVTANLPEPTGVFVGDGGSRFYIAEARNEDMFQYSLGEAGSTMLEFVAVDDGTTPVRGRKVWASA
mgnify:CR=1 FL=1